MTSTLENQSAPVPTALRDVRVAIIGSGFAGLGMAIALKKAGRARLRRPRAGARRRRHLAGQHLPRRRVRRAVQPLLVLLRAEPGLDAHLLRAAGDPGLPAGARPTRFDVRRHCVFGADVTAAPVGRRRTALGGLDHRRRVPGRRSWSRPPARWPSPPIPTSRAWTPSPARHATPPAGTRPRPLRRAGRRHRHRRLGHPVRAGDPADRRAASPSTSAPRRGSCPAPTTR